MKGDHSEAVQFQIADAVRCQFRLSAHSLSTREQTSAACTPYRRLGHIAEIGSAHGWVKPSEDPRTVPCQAEHPARK